jgi:choline dehydrogenase-like flavoprotein
LAVVSGLKEKLMADILIVGSGPAGISVAWPLVNAGHRVTVLEASPKRADHTPERDITLADLRLNGVPDASSRLLGKGLFGLRNAGHVSPKIRVFGAHRIDEFCRALGVREEGFKAIGVFAPGGLSNVWGAAVSAFDDNDLRGYPISAADLDPFYKEVANRVGVSGNTEDDMAGTHGIGFPVQKPLAVSPIVEKTLANYERNKRKVRMVMGQARSMVLTEDLGIRKACTLDNMCLWGCRKNSIYNSAFEIEQLLERPNFQIEHGFLVESLTSVEQGYRVCGYDKATRQRRETIAPVVILAAGTLSSTRLVLHLKEQFGSEVELLTTPCAAFALCIPGEIGSTLPELAFGMAQISFRADILGDETGYAFGQLYGAESVTATDLMAYMPISLRGAKHIVRGLLPSLVLGLLYMPSEYSHNSLRLEQGDEDGPSTLVLSGETSPETKKNMRKTMKSIATDFRRLGLYMLPRTFKHYRPGAEAHCGGTLPMGEATTEFGEVHECPNLFVVDGSVLNRLPAKHHTFTIMANACRIGHMIAAGTAKSPLVG